MRIEGKVVILDEDDMKSIRKVDKVIDMFIELFELMKSLIEKEQKMPIKSLELTNKEMTDNSMVVVYNQKGCVKNGISTYDYSRKSKRYRLSDRRLRAYFLAVGLR